MGWIKSIGDFVRKLFRRKKQMDEPEIVAEPSSFCLERICAQTMHRSLRVYSRRHPDVRVLPVGSFTDAYRHFLRMCDQRLLTHRYGAGHYYHTVTLPDERGQLVLTDNVGYRKDGAIAVLKINVADAAIQVREIRYKLTN